MNVSPRIKTERVVMSVSRAERSRIKRIATVRRMTVSALLLQLVAREEARLAQEGRR